MAEQDGAAGQSPPDSVPVRFVAFCLGWFGLSEFQVPLEAEACEVRLGLEAWSLRLYRLRVWFFRGRLACSVMLAPGLWRLYCVLRLGYCGGFSSDLVNSGPEEMLRLDIPNPIIRDRRLSCCQE